MEGINIGLDTSFLGHLVTTALDNACSEMSIPYQIKELQPCNLSSLASENIDLIILPLENIPFASEEDPWVIAGFLQRLNCNYFCYLNEMHPGVFGVKPNGKVAITDPQIKNQILELRPDIACIISEPTLALSRLQSKEIDAYFSNKEINIEGIQAIPIPSRDIVPKTSAGIYAIVCNKVNINARKISQLIHHDETGYESNVERAVALELDNSALINCLQDRSGNYHLNIYYPTNSEKTNRIQISQSTFVGLADRALNELKL